MSDSGSLAVLVAVAADSEADATSVERQVSRLRAELAELDVESVATVPGGVVPDGAKGADPVTIGALVVSLSASGGVVVALIETVRDWLGRQTGGHRVALTIDGDTIELDRATRAQQGELVKAFVRRHAGE
jgi:hypothetical protein